MRQIKAFTSFICSSFKGVRLPKGPFFPSALVLLKGTIFVVALTVGLSPVVSTGSSVQNYLLSLIYSDAPSIYGSAYQDGLVRFPEYRQWLAVGFSWPYPLIAAAIVLFSSFRSTVRDVFVSATIVSFLALTVTDVLYGYFSKTLSAGYVFENTIVNAIGGVGLGFVLVAMTIATNLIILNVFGPKMWRQVVAGIAVVLIGTCLNALVFYTAEFFYRPVPVKLDIVVGYPASGAIATRAHADKSDASKNGKDTARPFQLMPNSIDNSVIRWIGRGEKNNFNAQWFSKSQSAVFDAKIEFFADCFNEKINLNKSNPANAVHIKDVHSIELALSGWATFSTIDVGMVTGHLTTDFGPLSLFGLDQDADSKKITFTQFVQENASITILNSSPDLTFFVNAPMIVDTKKGITGSNRTLNFAVDGKSYSITADKPRIDAKVDTLTCASVEPKRALQDERTTIAGTYTYFGAVVTITKRTSSNSVYGTDDSRLKVSGGNGWATLTRSSENPASEQGALEFLAFKGNISTIDVDARPVPSRAIDEYNAFGDISGRLESDSKVRFSGTAKAFWKNGARVNPTKWERLDWNERLFIFAILVGIAGPVTGYIFVQIQKNSRLDWWDAY